MLKSEEKLDLWLTMSMMSIPCAHRPLQDQMIESYIARNVKRKDSLSFKFGGHALYSLLSTMMLNAHTK